MPGVLGVFTADDVAELAPLTAMVPLFPPPMMTRPWLSNETVRFVGEPMVAIVTEHAYQGEDAAEAVSASTTTPTARRRRHGGRPVGRRQAVYPELGTNVASTSSRSR